MLRVIIASSEAEIDVANYTEMPSVSWGSWLYAAWKKVWPARTAGKCFTGVSSQRATSSPASMYTMLVTSDISSHAYNVVF